jgi:hypothetical protein
LNPQAEKSASHQRLGGQVRFAEFGRGIGRPTFMVRQG